MRETLVQVLEWLRAGHRVALARVIEVGGSTPRGLGATLAMRDDGQIVGSVSGGCVESAVFAALRKVLEGDPPTTLTFPARADPWSVGLSCGGAIRVLVEPAPEEDVLTAVLNDRGVWITYLGGVQPPRHEWLPTGTSGAPSRTGATEWKGIPVFAQVIRPADRLIVVGWTHIGQALNALAKAVGFRTTVIEPRSALIQSRPLQPEPDELSHDWPDQAIRRLSPDSRTFAVILTHDAKLDIPALSALLATEAPYVGFLGGTKTRAARLEELREMGFDDAALQRIVSPVGLAIGAREPEEIAVSILAQVIQIRNGLSD
jgi:xanthine dehydrogenase accessory factor